MDTGFSGIRVPQDATRKRELNSDAIRAYYEIKDNIIQRFVELIFLMHGESFQIKRRFVNVNVGTADEPKFAQTSRLPILAKSRTELHGILDGQKLFRMLWKPRFQFRSWQMISLCTHHWECTGCSGDYCPDPVDKEDCIFEVDRTEVVDMYEKWLPRQKLAVLTALQREGSILYHFQRHPLYDRRIWHTIFDAMWPRCDT